MSVRRLQMQTDQNQEWLTMSEFVKRNEGVIGRTSLYAAVRRNEIPHTKVGHKILIPSDALVRKLTFNNGQIMSE